MEASQIVPHALRELNEQVIVTFLVNVMSERLRSHVLQAQFAVPT